MPDLKQGNPYWDLTGSRIAQIFSKKVNQYTSAKVCHLATLRCYDLKMSLTFLNFETVTTATSTS
jgi:hypothetical protein